MFDDLDINFKRSLQGWYTTNIYPIFNQARTVIIPLGKQGKLIPEYGYWWASYLKNSVVLLELMLINKYSNQSAFTMRILMEIAADTLFISQNKANILEFRKCFLGSSKNITEYSYKDFANTSKCLVLRSDIDHKVVKTLSRIKLAFGKEGSVFYEYLCNYTHLNYLGVIKDINIAIDGNSEMDYRLEFIKFYPDTFEAMIRAAKNLSCEDAPFDTIDVKKLRTIISDLVTKHSLSVVAPKYSSKINAK